MSHFRPLRASSPRRVHARPSSHASSLPDDSHPPGVIAPELVGLSAEEIDFIDEVIGRAPATASTFLTVFKAYNDVLQERGLDPQNEVVYYGKLLKIGTLKGKNWSDKWDMVKDQQGYVPRASTSSRGGRTTRVTRTSATPVRTAAKPIVQPAYAPRDPDTFTLHSSEDDMRDPDSRPSTRPIPRGRYTGTNIHDDTPRPLRRFGSPATFTSANSLGLETGPPSAILDSTDALRRLAAARAQSAAAARWDAETTAETSTQVSSHPPPYGAVVRDEPPLFKDKGKAPAVARRCSIAPDPSPLVVPLQPLPKEPVVPQSRERRTSVVDRDDVFEKIRMTHDEETADRFRNDHLVERCYDVWKQGFEWVITTGEQIGAARDSLVLRRALHQWRKRTATRREMYLRVAALSDRRVLKRFLHLWKLKLKEKKQVHWREDMRARMKVVRDRNELVLKKEMWSKWRQAYLSRLSEQQFARRVLGRFFNRWKTKLSGLDQLEAAADHFIYAREAHALDRYWDAWRHGTLLRRAEKTMQERVDLRIMANALDQWKRHHHRQYVAQQHHNALVVKHTFRRWQASQRRIRTLENRAAKHVARRDDVLVRAIMHIWKAHERGKLLTRVKKLRVLKQAWAIWKRRMEDEKEREEMAQLFRTRSSSVLAASVVKRWREVYQSHQNAQSFAVHYHRAQLQYKTLLKWRLRLRDKLRFVKQAKVAQKYLLLRRYFRVWAVKVEEKRRMRKLKEFEQRAAKRYFEEWRERATRQRSMKLAEQIIRERVALRIMTNSLQHWMTRVADHKFRELETMQSYNKTLVLHAYKKWKALCKRHVDELSLMESYQDVKREENMRKMFYRWLAAAKKARHRRVHLQAKEEEFKLTVIAGAWDKWRERFQDIRLQPMADAFISQRQRDLLFKAFAIWHSKSLSLPAVRFHALNLKARHWKKWRDLMPRALQAKAARETDRRNTLKKMFSSWRKAQQKKRDHKAINYARYLELLSSGPRQPPQPQRTSALVPRTRNLAPPRRTRPATPTEDEVVEAPRPPPSTSRPPFTRPSAKHVGLASLLTSKPRTASPERKPRSPERPKYASRRPATTREPSLSDVEPEEPAPPSYGAGISAWRKDVGAFPPRSAPPSIAGDIAAGRGRSSLWQELKEVRRRSRAPTERTSYSPEPA